MNFIFTPDNKIFSFFKKEDYIPITVIIKDMDYVKHIGFYHENTDFCEFGVDPETNNIVKFVLTLSNHYEFIDEQMKTPDAENGKIQIFLPAKVECDYFYTTVYKDGVLINLSNNESITHIRMGHLILSIDHNDTITDIYVVELDDSDITFIKNELELG